MGQKVNPVGLRLGINRGWDSVWYAKKQDFGNVDRLKKLKEIKSKIEEKTVLILFLSSIDKFVVR